MKDNSLEKESSHKNKEIIFDVLDSIPDSIIELDVVAQAITDLKETKKALQESEEKYRMVFSNVPLGILHFDSTGRITACNDNFLSISDSKKKQILGALLSEALDVNMVSAIERGLSSPSATKSSKSLAPAAWAASTA